MQKPATIDEYIDSFSPVQSEQLTKLRTIVRGVLPDSSEELKWGNPAFLDSDGMILVMMTGYKKHVSLVATPSTREAFGAQLTDYETGKGSIKFPYDKLLPKELIEAIVAHRLNEYRTRGVKWM